MRKYTLEAARFITESIPLEPGEVAKSIAAYVSDLLDPNGYPDLFEPIQK